MNNSDVEKELSSLVVDGVPEILDVAVGVLEDHAPDHGSSRIERLARFVLLNIRADVIPLERFGQHLFCAEGTTVYQCEGRVGMESFFDHMTPDKARRVATALVIMADLADRPCVGK